MNARRRADLLLYWLIWRVSAGFTCAIIITAVTSLIVWLAHMDKIDNDKVQLLLSNVSNIITFNSALYGPLAAVFIMALFLPCINKFVSDYANLKISSTKGLSRRHLHEYGYMSQNLGSSDWVFGWCCMHGLCLGTNIIRPESQFRSDATACNYGRLPWGKRA